MESKYSGKYHFEGDMVVLDVTYAFYENTTPVRPGDQLKMKVRYGQNNKGSFLILDSLSYKREK